MSGVVFRDVEVRAWPERADLLVIDYWSAELLAQYIAMDDLESPITDLSASYEQRSALAIRSIERDQEFLQGHFLTDDSVCLKLIYEPRQRMEDLLKGYDLSIDDSDFTALQSTARKLQSMPEEKLFSLLLDWHDVVERRYPAGSSSADQKSWARYAKPDVANHFANLSKTDDLTEAYSLFLSLINVPRKDFSFGLFLRWVYFHQTEFKDIEPEALLSLEA